MLFICADHRDQLPAFRAPIVEHRNVRLNGSALSLAAREDLIFEFLHTPKALTGE